MKELPKFSPPRRIPDALKDACIVLDSAYESARCFHETFKASRDKAGSGTTTDLEQDLLRAMLLFACAGLDATIKQIVSDALPSVIRENEEARRQFAVFIEKGLKQKSLEPDGQFQMTRVLATALASPSPQDELIRALVKSLTDNSLQSVDQLLTVASHFALTKDDFIQDLPALREAINVRNHITHEMDVDLRSKNRKRRTRAQGDMLQHTATILDVTQCFLDKVAALLK